MAKPKYSGKLTCQTEEEVFQWMKRAGYRPATPDEMTLGLICKNCDLKKNGTDGDAEKIWCQNFENVQVKLNFTCPNIHSYVQYTELGNKPFEREAAERIAQEYISADDEKWKREVSHNETFEQFIERRRKEAEAERITKYKKDNEAKRVYCPLSMGLDPSIEPRACIKEECGVWLEVGEGKGVCSMKVVGIAAQGMMFKIALSTAFESWKEKQTDGD